MTISSLVLTDGTTTATLTDGTNYALQVGGWGPRVARRRNSDLGGEVYELVEEQIALDVIGSSLTTLLNNMETLFLLIDQANDWYQGRSLAPVKLQITMNGSTVKECLITGGSIETPSNYAERLTGFEFEGVKLRLTRYGRWLAASEAAVVVAAAANPTVLTATWASTHPQVSPMKVSITSMAGATTVSAIVAIAPSGGIQIVEAEGGTLGADVASVADAAASARGGNVARYTAPVTPVATTIRLTLSGLPSLARRFAVVLPVRKNQTTTVFDVRCDFQVLNGADVATVGSTNTIRVTGSNTNPQLLVFSPASMREAPNRLLITITPITVAAGNTFDIDYAGVVQVDDPACGWVQVDSGLAGTLTFDALAEQTTPRAILTTAAAVDFPVSYAGDLRGSLNTRGPSTAVAVFATGGTLDPTRWRYYAGGAVVNLGLSVQRRRAYLVPE